MSIKQVLDKVLAPADIVFSETKINTHQNGNYQKNYNWDYTIQQLHLLSQPPQQICLVISGMNEPGGDENYLDKFAETLARESGINKDIVIKNTYKTHPIGKIDEKGL